MFWQLTVDAIDPERLAAFWKVALRYATMPPAEPETTWSAHYRGRVGEGESFTDRIFDPEGVRPPVWFQRVPEEKAGKNRLHLDLYPTGRDNTLSQQQRISVVERAVADLAALGATVDHRTRDDDPDDLQYYVVMRDPEGNEFCVS